MQGDLLDLAKLTPEQVIVALAYQLRSVSDDLARIEDQLKQFNAERSEHARGNEQRMRALEDWKTRVTAQQFLVAGAASTIISLAALIVGHFWK